MSGIKTTSIGRLIHGTYFINGIPLIAIIDTDVTHLFISLDYMDKLGLKLSSMDESMIVDTPDLGPVLTSWVCSKCSLTIYGKSFNMDLPCLPLRNLNVIFEMNRLEFNYVHINYFSKTM